MHLDVWQDYLALWLILSVIPVVVLIAIGSWTHCREQDLKERASEIATAAFWLCVLLWAVRRLWF